MLMANATEEKFGGFDTRLVQTDCWTLLLRPKQPTLGAMVLVCREPVRAFGELSEKAFGEMRGLVKDLEAVLHEFVAYERLNYLMLMMVDPDVHFHVIPRYQGERTFEGIDFVDHGWPGMPALESAVTLSPESCEVLRTRLRDAMVARGR